MKIDSIIAASFSPQSYHVKQQRAMSSLWVWPFELEEKIGEGGMGVVYRGRYVKNDRRVAVKLLPEDVADTTLLARFEREVEILKTLKHPNIVQSFGGVCEDKRRFYAMELVDGGTLDSLLKSRGGSLPWEQVIELGVQMCAALQYAHENKVIHRDLKPGNFLLTKDRKVKLGDFGLATVMSGTKLTASGKTVGSFRYMAPEQVRGKPEPVPQTDLYALGCVLFQMLTGRPPFDGTTAAELLNKQLLEQPPRVCSIAPEVPAALDRLVDSLLKKDIAERPTSAAEVSRQLQLVSMTTMAGTRRLSATPAPKTVVTPTIETPPKRKSNPNIVFGLVAGLAILGGFAAWQYSQRVKLAYAEELWVETFQDEKQPIPVRTQAAISLGKLAQKRPPVLNVLTAGLEHGNWQIRVASLKGLGETGTNARPYLPTLTAMQQRDTDQFVRQEAGTVAQKIKNSPEATMSWTTPIIITLVIVAILISGVFWYRHRIADAE